LFSKEGEPSPLRNEPPIAGNVGMGRLLFSSPALDWGLSQRGATESKS